MKEKRIIKIVLVCLLSIILVIICGYVILKNVIYPLNHFSIVKEEASKNNIDPYLVMAIIKTESGFKKDATSNKDAKGLMQIIDSTATDINNKTNIVDEVGENIYDENVNISLGCKYFSDLIKRYNGNYYLAICAYNAGMGNVDKWIEQGIIDKDISSYNNISLPYKETEKYLKKVMDSYHMYKVLYK